MDNDGEFKVLLCGRCNGTGKKQRSKKPCLTCQGTGKRWHEKTDYVMEKHNNCRDCRYVRHIEVPAGTPVVEIDRLGKKYATDTGGTFCRCEFGYWGGLSRSKELWPHLGEHGYTQTVFFRHGELCADFSSAVDGNLCDWCYHKARKRLGLKAVACNRHAYEISQRMRKLRLAEKAGTDDEILAKLRLDVNLL